MFAEYFFFLILLFIFTLCIFPRRVIITHLHEDYACMGDCVCLRSWDPVIEYNKFSSTDQSAANHLPVQSTFYYTFWHTFQFLNELCIFFNHFLFCFKIGAFEYDVWHSIRPN